MKCLMISSLEVCSLLEDLVFVSIEMDSLAMRGGVWVWIGFVKLCLTFKNFKSLLFVSNYPRNQNANIAEQYTFNRLKQKITY